MPRSAIRMLCVVLATLGLIACAEEPDPYAAYRQTTAAAIPGSFDWALEPVDEDFRAAIDPGSAFQDVFEAGSRPSALVILGRVRNTYDGTMGPPAWIFVTPHMCFATAKGDLVAPGRTGDGCVDENLYVQGVDAATGAPLGGFPAFEPVDGWSPARAGTPSPIDVTTPRGTTTLR
jgi:hypothetical protein